MFENIFLEQEQIDLLAELVEIVRSFPRNQRRKLIYVQDHDGGQLIIPGHPDKNLDVLLGDLETLSREGLLAQSYSSSGATNFDITPLGFRYVDDKNQRKQREDDRQPAPIMPESNTTKISGNEPGNQKSEARAAILNAERQWRSIVHIDYRDLDILIIDDDLNIEQFSGFSLVENNLTEFPKALLNYPHLEFIDLSNNHIKEIPPEIIVMENLETLNLSNNNIMSIPEILRKMPKLKKLDLADNPVGISGEFLLDEIFQNGTQKVFISYARLDLNEVEDIYMVLLKHEIAPWMDVHNIVGGENWLRSIYKAIDDCEIFLAVLSTNSVSKRGVIQKELKKALDKWEGMLPEDIYIIPLRIDDCLIPELLKDFQVINWNNGTGINKLLKAVRTGLARRRN